MATVIDSLIVTLGLDSKDVDAKAPGVRQKLADIEKAADASEKSTRGLSKELKAAGGALGGFLAILGGTTAIRAFVRDTTDANTQLHFLSQNLGVAVQKLFAMGAAGQEIGIGKAPLQSLAAMFRSIPGQLEAGQQPAVIKLLARAGINWLGSPQDQMVGLAKWFQTMPPNVALGLGTSYGLTYEQMTFLLQGAQRVAAELKQTGMYSPTGAQAAQFAELKKQIVDLGLQWTKVGYDLVSVVTPALEKFLGFLRAIGAWAQKHEKIVAVLAGIAGGLGAIGALAGAVGAVSFAWSGLMAALDLASPLIAVVGALASAIVLLWNDYRVWSEGGKSYFDWSKFAAAVRGAGAAFDYLGTKIEKATHAFEGWVKAHPKLMETLKLALFTAFPGLAPSAQNVPDSVRKLGYGIATAEGFFHKGANNIPQRANNPGDIEWGAFARAHGATGYLVAQGGHKIATFPDAGTGWAALYSMLQEKRFNGLSPAAAMAEYTRLKGGALSSYVSNSGLLSGISGASLNAALANSTTAHVSHSTDNSRVTNIGTLNVNNPNGAGAMTPGMARGMDWNTLVTQSNGGLQ